MTVVVRFAPSPTGLLHVGNARTALLNWLFAKKMGGKFLLRIDDTDAARSKEAYEVAINHDLGWLGITHDSYFRQSERIHNYHSSFSALREADLIYPCYETEQELERKRALLMARRKPPIYDRASLDLDNRAKWKAEGRKPYWPFKLSHRKVSWNDMVRGSVMIDTSTLSDPVLMREDDTFLYTLPSVVDDIDSSISHVVRGEDHVTNTAVQIEIFQALGAAVPSFAHFPLLVGAGGEALSKRLGSLSLESLQEDGLEPMALVSYLAKVGTSDPVEPRSSMSVLAEEFDFAKVGRAPAHFDFTELKSANSKLLHSLPYEAVVGRLRGLGITGGAEFWDAVKQNISIFHHVEIWWKVIREPMGLMPPAPGLGTAAAAVLPPEPWDETTWGTWTKAVSQATGLKGRELFHPLRLALTFAPDGPELKKLLPLIGRARVLARLKGETA